MMLILRCFALLHVCASVLLPMLSALSSICVSVFQNRTPVQGYLSCHLYKGQSKQVRDGLLAPLASAGSSYGALLTLQVLAEARVRLVAGLKRYFHDKRGQGLLSGRGIVVLDHACDVAMDASASPLVMWSSLERWAMPSCSSHVSLCCLSKDGGRNAHAVKVRSNRYFTDHRASSFSL